MDCSYSCRGSLRKTQLEKQSVLCSRPNPYLLSLFLLPSDPTPEFIRGQSGWTYKTECYEIWEVWDFNAESRLGWWQGLRKEACVSWDLGDTRSNHHEGTSHQIRVTFVKEVKCVPKMKHNTWLLGKKPFGFWREWVRQYTKPANSASPLRRTNNGRKREKPIL